jgi:hypothetical protein
VDVGRHENELDSGAGTLARFAAGLRELRRAAGNPSYRDLATRVHYSHNTLSTAASGRVLPSKAVTLAFVTACGGDKADWLERWQVTEQELAGTNMTPTGPQPPAVADFPWPVPRQLPGAPPHFAGRKAELGILDSQLTGGAGGPGAPVPTLLICGGGGIGKTSLALHWGHQHLHLFPDGQLFADLRGFDPAGQPLPAATALRGFLRALGVPDAAVPREEDAAAALYRSVLAGRRVLIVLDDAADTRQVASLLPGDSGCAVLITSRRRLPTLTARFGACSLKLTTLACPESWDLLSRHLGARRLADEPGAAADIIGYCAGMPLALAIFAARAGTCQDLPLKDMAAELRADADRLDVLEPGEGGLDPRAVFSCSVRALSPGAAEMLALLALSPGADIDTAAAASLAGLPLPRTRTLLRELEDAHLVDRAGCRHSMHDLVRLFALEHARATLAKEQIVDRPFRAKVSAGRMPPVLRTRKSAAIPSLVALVLGVLITALSGGAGARATVTSATASASPLLFGENLDLYPNTASSDWFLSQPALRAGLVNAHVHVIRLPIRGSSPSTAGVANWPEVQAALQDIQAMGLTPLVILRNPQDPTLQADDSQVVSYVKSLFGRSPVYYEWANETDLPGSAGQVSAATYLASWNSNVPQLKALAGTSAQFIGPVNYQYDPSYLQAFLAGANPLPDAISWHAYTCNDATDSEATCLANIDHWTTDIAAARSLMTSTTGEQLPIWITEWNYTPSVTASDSKHTDVAFLQQWTTKALRTLAANCVTGSMHFNVNNLNVTNGSFPLVNFDGSLAPEGVAFSAAYTRTQR